MMTWNIERLVKVMTRKQAGEHWEKGNFIVLGEYVGTQAEVLEWRDKTNGKAMAAPLVKHSVVIGNRVAVINQRVPETTDVAKFSSGLTARQPVVVLIESMQLVRGLPEIRGKLEAITA